MQLLNSGIPEAPLKVSTQGRLVWYPSSQCRQVEEVEPGWVERELIEAAGQRGSRTMVKSLSPGAAGGRQRLPIRGLLRREAGVLAGDSGDFEGRDIALK